MEPKIDPSIFVWQKDSNNNDDFVSLVNRYESDVRSSLYKHGSILFKGFNIDDDDKLESCINSFGGTSLNYIDGNSPRTKIGKRVYTSTEYPAEAYISLHNELSYCAAWPTILTFCCRVQPETGGHTTIADSRQILSDLPSEIVEEFDKKGVKYIRNLHSGTGALIGKSWQQTFETYDKSLVEYHCKNNEIEFTWTSDGGLRLIQDRPAIISHSVTNERVWFNQADQFHPSTNAPEVWEALQELYSDPLSYPQNACFGDGTEIPIEMLETIRKVSDDNIKYFEWRKGDLLVLDNVLMAHGRSPFTGKRTILLAFSA
jgi:alpha-ketoglutarate-dependent taurine dioxygenase